MDERDIFEQLDAVLAGRQNADPAVSYTASLIARGPAAITAKIGEEASEVIAAAAENDDSHLIFEVADLWFHCMVLLASRGLDTRAVAAELARRFGVSGIAEKAARGT
jgi:phosphoribosyl-ATP pyrophosphohydrolase